MDYDLIIAGGSVSGAALGFAARRQGARVLIVERTTTFQDQIRGEALHPWGVHELQRLGLASVVERAPAASANYWDTHVGGMRVDRRDLAQTSRAHTPGMNVHHPELQNALLTAAQDAGADVMRAARVCALEPGAPVWVSIEAGARTRRLRARLAVIADGRGSRLRRELAVPISATPSAMRVAGVLVSGVPCPEAAISAFYPATFGALAALFPLPGDRARIYFAYHRALALPSYAGSDALAALFERCTWAGMPSHWLEHARAIGPLATIDTTFAAPRSAALPGGIAFIGDAAGNVDPTFGCGLSLALRDARCLAECLARDGDVSVATADYARQRATYHRALRRIEGWLTRVLYETGPGADALRASALPRVDELGVDVIGAGPDSPCDDETERRIFGSDSQDRLSARSL